MQVRRKRRKVDPNYLEKLEAYRAQAREKERAMAAVVGAVNPNHHQSSVESISAFVSASVQAPVVPVPGFGRAPSSSLKERQCAEEASSSTSSSSTVHVNDVGGSDADLNALSPQSPVGDGSGDGDGEVGLVKQKEKKSVVRWSLLSIFLRLENLAMWDDNDD